MPIVKKRSVSSSGAAGPAAVRAYMRGAHRVRSGLGRLARTQSNLLEIILAATAHATAAHATHSGPASHASAHASAHASTHATHTVGSGPGATGRKRARRNPRANICRLWVPTAIALLPAAKVDV
jgi:hypothetical protein